MVKPEISSGTVILAEPFMMDPNFRRAAILLCEHNDEGTFGLVMNKPLSMRVDNLIDDFPEFDAPVHFGGPVQTDTVHFIHCKGDLVDQSRHIKSNLYYGGDYQQLKALIARELIQPNDIRFFVGYSGWTEGQLEDEMRYNSWVTAPMHGNYLFKSKPSTLWSQVMSNKGNVFSVIARMRDEPNFN